MILDRAFDLLVIQSWQVALVGSCVWIVVTTVASDRPHLAHALWALVLLKCVTPPIWTSPTSPFSWWIAYHVQTVEIEQNHASATTHFPIVSELPISPELTESSIAVASFPNSPTVTPPWRFPSLRTSVAGIWMLGVLCSLLLESFRFTLLLALVRRTRVATPDWLEMQVRSLARTFGMSGRARVRVLDAQIGPAVMGFWRPMMLLPQSIVAGRDAQELQPLLAHELIHIRRGDLYWAVLQAVAKACLWFHPVVWLASRQIDQESERCCDEETIANLGCAPSKYARMLLDILEAKHRLRVIPALPGVRPVDVTAKRLERIMRFGDGSRNGIHVRRPWWTTAILLIGMPVILPGATRVIGQDRAASTTAIGSQSGQRITANENHPFLKDVNYARQIGLETKLIHLPTRLLDGMSLSWANEANDFAHCVLDEHATQEFVASLAGSEKVVRESSRTITLFDGSDWQDQQINQRTFVTAWEPFPGQEDQPVRTLSPVTEEVQIGFRLNANVRCLDAGSDIHLTVQNEVSSITSVETSMFHFENDIGGEPHPVQTPKIVKRGHAVDAALPLHASLVIRQPAQDGTTTITLFVYRTLHETPEEAVKRANFLATHPSPSPAEVAPATATERMVEEIEQTPVAKIYVDSGVDFTAEQIELIASRHDKLGFESVQIKNGRLRVHPQELAHIATAWAMAEAKRPENRPLLRGGKSGQAFDYTLLTSALQSRDIPCRIEGEVEYTINRHHIDLQATPIEISYADSGQSFYVRADSGEVRLKLNARGDEGQSCKFSGNVVVELNDAKITSDAIETDATGFTLQGNIVIQRSGDPKACTITADKFWIDPAWNSIEEIIKHARPLAH